MAPETHQDANLTAPPAGGASVPTVDAAAVLKVHVGVRYAVTSAGATPRTHGALIHCATCHQPWRGAAETGGCTAVLLARRVARLEGLLREHEWCGQLASTVTGLPPAHYCPSCFNVVTEGHRPDCRYVAAVADGG